MPRKDTVPHITAAELRILKVLWRIGPATVRDVKTALEADGDEPPAYTTVMTLMNQLATKKGLSVDRTRQPFVYTPVVRRDQVLAQRVRQFVSSVFDGRADELVLHLVEQAELSPDELRRIEAKIEALEQDDAPANPDGASREREDA